MWSDYEKRLLDRKKNVVEGKPALSRNQRRPEISLKAADLFKHECAKLDKKRTGYIR